MSFAPPVRELFIRWKRGDLLVRLEALHQQLLDRRKDAAEFPDPDELRKRTASNCLVMQQVLLHRSERLLVGAGTMLLESNICGLALIVRGHYEATAILGNICNRLEALKAGDITFEVFAKNIAIAFLGANHPQFTKAPKPPNILTCIERTDKYLDVHYYKEKTGMLRDCYDWLSEFSHPNFLSHSSAFAIDKAHRRCVFRHEGDIQDRDFDLIEYLEISTNLFLLLFNNCVRSLAENDLL